MKTAIEKQLSGNDTGETGGHQAGMLVPRDKHILGFFPKLSQEEKNPRKVLDFVDEAGRSWSFNFIYYNNKFFGGTRNEYRLTGMTQFIRASNLKTGDTLIFQKNSEREWLIKYRRANKVAPGEPLKLGGSGWRTLDLFEDK